MLIHQFEQKQLINGDIDTVWSFFASAKNLTTITPADMNFKIIEGGSDEIYKGQLIKYKVSPFPFLRLTWVTEIVAVDKKRFFADDQKKGPFAMWYHQHLFSTVPGGVEMKDHVCYSIPFGKIGRRVGTSIVTQRVQNIFDYRRKQIEIIFPQQK